jgi:hypothetical protein
MKTELLLLLLLPVLGGGRGGGALRLISTGLVMTWTGEGATTAAAAALACVPPGAEHGVVEGKRLFNVGGTAHVDVGVAA